MSISSASSARLHAGRVALVAEPQVGRERVGADVGPLGWRRARADVAVRDEVDLHLGVGRDDGADVPALDDGVALLRELALALAHHLADLRMAGDDGTSRSIAAGGSLRDVGRPRSSTRPSSSNSTGCSSRELAQRARRRRADSRCAARAT